MAEVIGAKELEFFSAFLQERSGYKLMPEKIYLLEGRLQQVFKNLGRDYTQDNLRQVVSLIQQNPLDETAQYIVEAMTVNETSFFRDSHFRQQIEDLVRIKLLSKILSQKRPLRVWSAACSSGQEAYSVAMVLERLRETMAGLKYQIVGTDLSTSVVRKAQSGHYLSFDLARGVTEEDKDRFFVRQGDAWMIKDDIKRYVSFKVHNLLHPDSALKGFDLVLLRNVLFYFNECTRAHVLRHVHGAMNIPGYLILGATENLQGVESRFAPLSEFQSVYAQKEY